MSHMSASPPGASVPSHEIRVILASKGHVCLQTPPTKDVSSVKALKLYLQTITNINIHQQVLLTSSGAKLPDGAALSSYLDHTLFLFDKSHFMMKQTKGRHKSRDTAQPIVTTLNRPVIETSDFLSTNRVKHSQISHQQESSDSDSSYDSSSSSEEDEEDILLSQPEFTFEEGEVNFPSYLQNVGDISEQHEEDSSSNFLILKYQKHFYTHNEYISTIIKRSQSCHQKIHQFYDEIKLQFESIKASINNLRGHADRIQTAIVRFNEDFRNDAKRFRKHSNDFDANLEKLGKIPILDKIEQQMGSMSASAFTSSLSSVSSNSSLAQDETQESRTLRDCIKEPQLRKWREKCLSELDVFSMHINESEKQAKSIEKAIRNQMQFNVSPTIDFQKLRQLRDKSKELLEKERAIQKKLSEDYDTFYETFKDQREREMRQTGSEPNDRNAKPKQGSGDERQSSSSDHTSQHRIESELRSLAEIRHMHFDSAKKHFEEIRSILRKFCYEKRQVKKEFFKRLRQIATTQYELRKLTNRYSSTFNTIYSSLKKKFSQIELIYYLPGAYQVSLMEIVRRREFMRTYENEISKAKARIDQMRKNEQEKEKRFNRYVGKYVPPHLIPSLKEQVPECVINLHHSQAFSSLPQISKSDVSLSQIDEVQRLFNSEYTEEDLKIYDKSMDSDHFFEEMDMLSSNMVDESPSLDQSGIFTTKDEGSSFLFKRKVEHQSKEIDQLTDENKSLKSQFERTKKEAERAENARQKHAEESDALRARILSMQEQLKFLANSNPKLSEQIDDILHNAQ